MKKGLIIYLTFLSFYLHAQVTSLEPDNPSPRRGEQITLYINIKKENLDWLDQKNERTVQERERLLENRIAAGSLKISKVMTDTGLVKIGPFRFEFGNETYETPSIDLRIRPSLPEAVTSGLWLTFVPFDGNYFLIVEQRIPLSWKDDPANQNAVKLDMNNLNFASLNLTKLEQAGLKLVSSSESTDQEVLDHGKGSETGTTALRISRYKFKPTNKFKGKTKLDKTYFLDFPKQTKFEDVWIN